jgi:penicillin-insensitive murein endopeptidase
VLRPALALAAVLTVGCYGTTPRGRGPTSIGAPSSGYLHEGIALPERGTGFTRARRGEETRFGTPQLVGAITGALESVVLRFPGTIPTRVGDVSSPLGGRHRRHRSHRVGRDVDVLFFVTDHAGRSVQTRWMAFSRFGHAFDDESGEVFFYDDARNWHFVRTLLLDSNAAVQWIFVSRGLKTRLLDYAIAHEPDRRAIVRAAYVLQQPENASPHDDHFHVRVYCTGEERAAGCRDTLPRWPWLRPDVEETDGRGGPGLDDASLVAMLLGGEDEAREP